MSIRKTWLLMSAAVLVASLSHTVPAAAADSLNWAPCADEPASSLRCATLPVPLDYRDPGGRKIELAVSKLASTEPSRRRGVLLMNPGGPGGSGLGMPLGYAPGMDPAMLGSYDLIGFDPRGVGRSSPVTCDLQADQRITTVPRYALDAADVQRQAVYAKKVAQQCGASRTASLLPYISTANTARDMDRIREALGEKKISYYGASFGTYLGAVYTTLFPHRSDRFVLDSVVGPRGTDVSGARLLSRGGEDRFPDFAGWAAARHGTYALGRTADEVKAKFFALARRLDGTPESGYDGNTFRGTTFGALYGDDGFPGLAELWHGLDVGAEVPAPEIPPVSLDNPFSSQLHVICNDNEWPSSLRTYQRNVAQDRVRYPLFGAAPASVWPCAFWPVRPLEPAVRITDRGPSNLLLVQNLRDPASPLVGAQQTRAALGDRARMVTVDQGGHGVYQIGGNRCGTDAVTRYFVTGERPARDSLCAAARP